MDFLSRSIQGAALILAVTVLRALSLNRLPKNTFLALWFLCAVRLLVPFSIPSVLSVYSLFGRAGLPKSEMEMTAARAPLTQLPAMVQPAGEPAGISEEQVSETLSHVPAWTWVWIVGMLVCIAVFAYRYLRCLREFRTSLPVEDPFITGWIRNHKCWRRITARQSDRVPAPLTYGILRPVILLPKGAEQRDRQILEYVLFHEYVHIRCFDSISKLLFLFTAILHWFNPAVWVMWVLSNRDLELRCDEAVIRHFDRVSKEGDTRADYARALLAFEETRDGYHPLYNNFSKNALQERMVAIMKHKKITSITLASALLLTAGTAVAFGTSAAEIPSDAVMETTVTEQEILSYTDPADGRTYYSFDGGKTFAGMTEEEFDAACSSANVEWWTYEEYKAWLEKEKKELQGMLGEKGWTGGRGEFTWTQEIIDETIAAYEKILEDIKNGYLYSKTVDGSDDVQIAMSPANAATENAAETVVGKSSLSAKDYAEYEPFGLTVSGQGDALYYQGKRVRYFMDSVDLENGAVSSWRIYYDEEGEVSLHTVRSAEPNPNGSTNPFGPILRMEEYSEEEAEKMIQENALPSGQIESTAVEESASDSIGTGTGRESSISVTVDEVAAAQGDGAEEGVPLPGMFEKYEPYGIVYQETETANGTERNLYYKGEPVNRLVDQEPNGGIFTFGSSRQSEEGLTVYASYEDGKLSGITAGKAGGQ